MSWKIVKIAAISALCLLVIGCRTRVQPVYEVRGAPIPVISGGLSLADIRGAIRNAAYRRNWKINNRGGNQLLAIQKRPKHHAEVLITFSPAQFSMSHYRSSGLLFKNGRIHRTYNKWVRSLEKEIRNELARTRGRQNTVVPATRRKTVVPATRRKTVVPATRRYTTPTSRKPSRVKSVVPN